MIKKHSDILELVYIAISLVAIKYGFHIVAILYPFALFRLIKRHSLLQSTFLFFVLGATHFLIIWFYVPTVNTGAYMFTVMTLASSLSFGLSALFSKLLFHLKYIKDTIHLQILTFASIFLVTKFVVFTPLFHSSFFIEGPLFFTFILNYIHLPLLNTLFFLFSIYLGYALINKKRLLVLSCVTLLGILYSVQIYFDNKDLGSTPARAVTVAALQINIDENYKEREKHIQEIYEEYKILTREAAKNGADVVIWSEYAVILEGGYNNSTHTLVTNLDGYNKDLLALSQELNVSIIYGYADIKDGKHYNAAQIIDRELGVLDPYYATNMFLASDTSGAGYGDEYKVHHTSFGNITITICYETLDRTAINNYAKLRVDTDFHIILANNEFLDNSYTLNSVGWNYQLVASTIARPLIASTNTGPTVYINKYGKIIKQIPKNQKGILYATISY